ncbi:MAG: hypothetical protein H6Q68_2212 [Firmicutes bacterium]|nr:hypothetical protein [Bacillota bacterium]
MKKMLILMLAMFVLSLSSIVSAHSIQGNWPNTNYQIYAVDEQPPQLNPNDPPQSEKHKHEKHKKQLQPQPQEPSQPDQQPDQRDLR